MRELKFRVWDIDCHRFEHFEIGENDDCYGMFRVAFNKFGSVIEQYTGLKDKKGKEVYEGDIVKMPEWQVKPKYEVVKYCKAGFNPFQEGCFGCMSLDGEEVEVIGNIHENPELLG